jgi:hypothetical protein
MVALRFSNIRRALFLPKIQILTSPSIPFHELNLYLAATINCKTDMKPQIFILFALTLLPEVLMGQVFMPEPHVGTELAQGGSSVAISSPQFGMSNPATLAFLEQKVHLYAGTAIPYGITNWSANKLSFGLKLGKTDGIGLRIANNVIRGYSENVLSFQYAHRLGEKAALGVSLGAQYVQAAEYGSSIAPSVQVHFLQKLNKSVTLGVSISNLGQLKTAGFARQNQYLLGISYAASKYIAVQAEASKDALRPTVYRLGMRYSPTDRYWCYVGMSTSDFAKAAFGVGFHVRPRLRIDLAGSWHTVLGITPSLGVNTSF